VADQLVRRRRRRDVAGNLVGSPAVPVSAFANFWSRMATIYAGNPLVSYGLVNEPNNMSTMQWWTAAQAAVAAIRKAGSTQRILVPGNDYTAASQWTANWYDTDAVQRSNAYGWLNANGPGKPLADPLNNTIVEVHTYLDPDEGGSTTEITSVTAARNHLANVVEEARLRGYRVFLGEIGFFAGQTADDGKPASAAWADFVSHLNANSDTLVGYTWWAAGAPGWWDDVGADGGGHFSTTPTSGATFTGDTVNMTMIQNDF
jgi:endoglucanase